MFSGDDSLLFGAVAFPKKSEDVANVFNLEAKFLQRYKYPYFCSKFLIPSGENSCAFVPDPVKLVTKLGRADLVNWTHAREYMTSLRDFLKCYRDASIHPFLSEAVSERYALTPRDFSHVFTTIAQIVYDEERFLSLYRVNPGDVLCEDPSRPVL